ncbi:MAG TPA: hypothetical protein VHW01_28335 [Polyangiaceae bacterium]|nr:hypothetical protein [Polyangiaceae bacterium]
MLSNLNLVVTRWALAIGVGIALPCLTSACDRRDPPSEIRLEMPNVIASRDFVTVAVHALNAQGVSSNGADAADFVVEPRELATVSKPALLKCERSGDGKLNVAIAGVSRSVAVRCRLVDHLDAPDAGRVELSAGPFVPKVRVLDKAGTELSDVDVTFFSKNSGVAFPQDGKLVPKSVGTANLVAHAGEASADFKVDVVRKVVVEALPIEKNHKIYFSLEPGKYELKVTLPSPERVNFEWRGAPYCNTASDGTEHVSTCLMRAQGGGGVVFDNPAYLRDSSSKTLSLDGVELYEVP